MTIDELDKVILNDSEMQDLAKNDPTAFDAEVAKLYHSEGYNEYGAPLSLVQRGIGKVSRATGIPEPAIQMGAAMPIPAITTGLGALAGGAVNPALALPGAMAGSLAGEEANSALGITEPMDATSRGLAAGAPLLGPGISRGKQAFNYMSRFAPGGGAGMNELAAEVFEKGLGRLRVTKDQVDTAFTALRSVPDFKIKVPQLTQFLQEALTTARKSEKYAIPEAAAYVKKLEGVRDKLLENPIMSFKEFDVIMKDLSQLKEAAPDEIWGRASAVLVNDLETATANPNLSASTRTKATIGLLSFKNALKTNNRFKATEIFDNLLKRVVQPAAGDTNLIRFDKKTFIKGLDNAELKEAFSTNELASIKDAVENIGYFMGPPSKAGNTIPYLGRSGSFAALGWGFGGAIGAIIGFGGQQLITDALSTDVGRKVIKYLATTGKGKINMLELQSIMGKVVAGTMAGLMAGAQAPTEGAINAFPNES